MRHVRMLGLCLVAAFAFAAVAAAGSASAAEPEWGACVEQKHGHYTDANCQTEAASKKGVYKGKYEWKSGAPVSTECVAKKKGDYLTSACNTEKEKKGVPEEHKGKFEKLGPKFSGAGGAGVLTTEFYECQHKTGEGEQENIKAPREDCNSGNEFATSAYSTVECTSEHANGNAVGSDEVANIRVLFTGCTAFGVPATSQGLQAGEIETRTLKGKLGYINKSNHEVGVLLEPTTAGGQFAEFEALNGLVAIGVGVGNSTEGAFWEETAAGVPNGHDGVISPITPVDQMTHTFTQVYKSETGEAPCTGVGAEHCRDSLTYYRNVPSSFEGGQLEVLEDYNRHTEGTYTTSWSPASQEITNVNTEEGEAEIKG
jgi:hypothetical protein